MYLLGFWVGNQHGMQHILKDSTIFTVQCYDPENPYENMRPDGTNQTIFIEIDGRIFERGMYQG